MEWMEWMGWMEWMVYMVCNVCGMPAHVTRDGGQMCKLCERSDVSLVKLPYGTKLLMQELCGLGVVTRIVTKPYKEED